jgi:hypothetical protein
MHTGAAYHLICDTHSEPGSVLLAVTDDAGRIVGEAGLKVGQTWQLTSFAFQPRHSMAAAALCHTVVQALRLNRVRDFTATVDRPGREFLAMLGLLATTSSVADILDRQRRINPEGYRLVTQGQGLDDVEFPYPAELLTAPATPALAG